MDIQNLLRIQGEEVVSVAAAKEAEEAVPVVAVEDQAEADLVAADLRTRRHVHENNGSVGLCANLR